MSILKTSAVIKAAVNEGNYELPLVDIKEVQNEQGGYVQLTFKNQDTEVIHNIFGKNSKQITYSIQTLGKQVGIIGDKVTLSQVLVLGMLYKLYVSYNEYGRNVSFGIKRESTNEEAVAAL